MTVTLFATLAFANPPEPPTVAADPASVAHCATSARLVGASCSYTTGMMARRIMEDGREWSARGALTEAADRPDGMIATPYVFEATPAVHLLATEFLEQLATGPSLPPTLDLSGRLLEVDGVRYAVLTSYRVVPAR